MSKQAYDLPAVVGVCSSDSSLTWLSFLLACKGCILTAGLFLAFGTRRVKISALNDSCFIAMSVYGIVIVSIALTPIGFLLQHYPNVQYGITGIVILLSTSLILGLLFVTKVSIQIAGCMNSYFRYLYICRCTKCIKIQREHNVWSKEMVVKALLINQFAIKWKKLIEEN